MKKIEHKNKNLLLRGVKNIPESADKEIDSAFIIIKRNINAYLLISKTKKGGYIFHWDKDSIGIDPEDLLWATKKIASI